MSCLMCESELLGIIEKYRCTDRPSRYLFRDRHIVRCRACGFKQIDPLPSEEELRRYYHSVYRQDTWKAGPELEQFPGDNVLFLSRGRAQAQLVSRFLRKPDAKLRILDVGGGYGHTAWSFRERYPQASIFVCEPDPACLPTIMKAGAEVIPHFLDAQGAVEAVRRHGPFDIEILSHVLEHPVAPKRFLKQMIALLQKGGLVLIEVPNCPALFLSDDASHAPHISFFTADTLEKLILEAGGDVLFLDHCGPRWRSGKSPMNVLKRMLIPRQLRARLRRLLKRDLTQLSTEARASITRSKDFIPLEAVAEYGGTERIWLRVIARF